MLIIHSLCRTCQCYISARGPFVGFRVARGSRSLWQAVGRRRTETVWHWSKISQASGLDKVLQHNFAIFLRYDATKSITKSNVTTLIPALIPFFNCAYIAVIKVISMKDRNMDSSPTTSVLDIFHFVFYFLFKNV